MRSTNSFPTRQIRAVYDDHTIRVYQAYGTAIAESLHTHQSFVDPPFRMARMTWVKPSFLWMMYRCGWSYKDDGQRRVFAFDIQRQGFEWALANSCPSHPKGLSKAEARSLMDQRPVRVQWDPERDIHLNPLGYRSIQIGLRGEAIQRYTSDWIVNFEEVTDEAKAICEQVKVGRVEQAVAMLPNERPYPLAEDAARHVDADL